ncbi:hypothetical protein, conserved [Plasmodium gonderi]|uniref:Uncharacterized protein n=1 Tax=Plasmodium gonderi TaxID=77519 RepID=A0A1Y1JM21_PLAGO|nr:hypothetical protein, conserved [Plasmodium gonderi]GAW81433.1 hypothetical protein, conserved [Plasmodium gonderi]
MDALTYLKEYSKIFEFVNHRKKSEENHKEENGKTCLKEEKHYSKMNGKSTCITPTSCVEEKNRSRKSYIYRKNENKYQRSKTHKANEYDLSENVADSSNLSLKTKSKLIVNYGKYEIKRYKKDTMKKYKTDFERICICKKCYMNQMHEKKKRTTVYTLEFNNSVDSENMCKYNFVKRNTSIHYDLAYIINKHHHKRLTEEGNQVMVGEHFPEEIPHKKNLFHFLNSIFSVN